MGSSGFVQSDDFLFLAVAAQKFGCRPSELAGLRDPVLALDFDLAAAARLLAADRAAVDRRETGVAEDPSVQTANEVRW